MNRRTSTTEQAPLDPIGDAVADALSEILAASVELAYAPTDTPSPPISAEVDTASATGAASSGWLVTYVVRLKPGWPGSSRPVSPPRSSNFSAPCRAQRSASPPVFATTPPT